MIIPIGVDCTSAIFKREINKISPSLPFDWMISTPEFVVKMLELLLVYNMNTTILVREHFFRFDKSVKYIGHHNIYITTNDFTDESIICNSKYNVLFPNDKYNEETIAKYIRRFERLKAIIFGLDYKEELKFVYASACSQECSNYSIDGKNTINDVYIHLMKINSLLAKYRKNYKLILFDALCTDDKSILHQDNIILIPLSPETHPNFLITQMVQYAYLFHFTIYKFLE